MPNTWRCLCEAAELSTGFVCVKLTSLRLQFFTRTGTYTPHHPPTQPTNHARAHIRPISSNLADCCSRIAEAITHQIRKKQETAVVRYPVRFRFEIWRAWLELDVHKSHRSQISDLKTSLPAPDDFSNSFLQLKISLNPWLCRGNLHQAVVVAVLLRCRAAVQRLSTEVASV